LLFVFFGDKLSFIMVRKRGKMKKILQLIGVCCFGVALISGDVCGVQITEKQRELLNPGVVQVLERDPEDLHILTEKDGIWVDEYGLASDDASHSSKIGSIFNAVCKFFGVGTRWNNDTWWL
jgi:hypothetical protein